MRARVIVVVLLLAALLAGTVTATASNLTDMLRPKLNRISQSVEQLTGWDCQTILVERDGYLAAGLFCQQ